MILIQAFKHGQSSGEALVTLFEKTPFLQVLSHTDYEEPGGDDRFQFNLSD